MVCHAVSSWLFRARAHRLPLRGARKLPRDRLYWLHLKRLFSKAQGLHSGKRL